jgi:hypothetical protein
LYRIAIHASAVFDDAENEKEIEALESDVREAGSFANELRYLRSLMNEEKF